MQGGSWKGPSELGNTHKENFWLNLAELTQEKERKAVGALMLRQEEEEQCWSKKQAVHGADVCGPLILNLLRPRFFFVQED